METTWSEHKQLVLRSRNYVFLDGKWRRKGGGPPMSDFAVRVLGEADFACSVERYEAALARQVHQAHLGVKLFSYGD